LRSVATVKERVRAFIVGDPQRRTWERHDESLEAFKERLAKAAADVARNQSFPTYGDGSHRGER